MTDYNARLRLGAHWWDIDYLDGDVARPAVIAGLTYGWSAPQDRGWPPPRKTLPFDTLTVTIRADAAEDVADIAKGQVGYFDFTPDGYPEPLVRFAGRLGDPSIKPRLGADGHGDGVYLTVTISDYLVDLTSVTHLGGGVTTLWSATERQHVAISFLGNLWGYGDMFLVPTATLDGLFDFPAEDLVVEGIYTDLQAFQLLGVTPASNYDDNGDLDPVNPWLYPFIDPLAPTADSMTLGDDIAVHWPYGLGLDGGGFLTIAGGGLGADVVSYESLVWSRDREPNYLEVTDPDGVNLQYYWRGAIDGVPFPDDPATRRTGRFRYGEVNSLSMQVDAEEHDPWGPESFVVRAYLDPLAVDGWLRWPSREYALVNLSDLRSDQVPSGRTWVAGMLGGARLVIPADGKWYVTGVMRRTRVRSDYRDYEVADPYTFDDLGADFPAVTFDQVDPDLTFNDLDLIGDLP